MRSVKRTAKIMAVLAAAAIVCCGCAGETDQSAKEDVQQTEAEDIVPSAEEVESGDSEAQQVTEETPEEEAAEGEKETLSIAEVYEKIGAEVSLQSPECMDDDFISNYYGLDTALLEEYVFSISSDAAQAETVIIAKVKDVSDTEAVAESLQSVMEDKKAEMENYIPEQFAIVEKSEVVIKDNYVWLVISENKDSITSVIENNLF